MTISNKLTIFRILLVPFFVWFMISSVPNANLYAVGFFILASVTDFLDGYLARKRNEITDFGKFLDPIADKILVISALVCLVERNLVPSWAVIIIIAREFIVSGLRMSAASKNIVIAADKLGKMKTVVQMIAIILLIMGISIKFVNKYYIPYVLFYFAVVLTILSGISYLVKGIEILKEDKQ